MLKQVSIFLLALTTFQSASSQSGPDTVYLKGLDLMSSKKYDSALKLFYNMYDKSGYKYYSRALNNIAEIQLKLGNSNAADSLYRMCLKDTNRDSQLEKYLSALGLADICISKRKFGEALYFLDNSKEYNPEVYSERSFDDYFRLNWKYSVCLNELNYLDSAINCLTPFMFQGEELLSYNKNFFNKASMYYHSLLLKKFNSCQLVELVNEAINNLQYVQTADTISFLAKKGYKGYNVECKLLFLGKPIWLLNMGYSSFSRQEPINHYDKEYCLRNIKKSPLYKMIME